MSIKEDHILDAKGLFCPEPVMMLHNIIKDIAVGEVLKVIATDASTTRDIPKFCTFLNHPLLGEAHTEDEYVYYIRKEG